MALDELNIAKPRIGIVAFIRSHGTSPPRSRALYAVELDKAGDQAQVHLETKTARSIREASLGHFAETKLRLEFVQ
ncbi:hypothetical protein BP6252_08635 [Coleophoma cylindrospora]|uniref:Uncharacterized protein n=1 Tax=Coleophoma cylindrospora TaxID=1849047 RepID=A0A3D8R6E1_9HELO|nr:hypothetical protein BP6252_08635 [Coleophoma cylindrospora]